MRYSLRTLFVATFLFALLLAISFRLGATFVGIAAPLFGAVVLNVALVGGLMALLSAVERLIRQLRR